MNHISNIKDNINNFSIYGMLDWLEYFYKLPIDKTIPQLLFKSNISMSSSCSDINQIHYRDNQTIVTLNNIGIFGIQGSMPIYSSEEVIKLLQQGDNVLPDFIDIFNHRIVQIMYKARKSIYFHYYDPERLGRITSNFIDARWITILGKNHLIYIAKTYSRLTLSELIAQMLLNRAKIIFTKTCSRWIRINDNRFKVKNILRKSLLGQRCLLNDCLRIEIMCLDREIYNLLLVSNEINLIKSIIDKYYQHYVISIKLSRSLYQKTILGESRLNYGIHL